MERILPLRRMTRSFAGAPERPRLRWLVCLFLFAATTINYMDRSVLALIEPLLHQRFMGWVPGLPFAAQVRYQLHYGEIVECFQVAYGVGFLVGAPLIDRLGTRLGYALSIAIWALASLSHSLVHSVMGFCLARAVLGLGESGNFPAAIKATTEWFPTQERALATGLFNSGANAAFFLAPAVLPLVTAQFGWRAAFLTTGSAGLLWLVCWLLFPYNRLRRSLTTTQVNLEETFARMRQGSTYGTLLRSRGTYGFAAAKACTDPVWWFYLFFLPMFLNNDYGVRGVRAYWPLVAVYAFSSIGSILGGGLSGFLIRRGASINAGRKLAMLVMALAVLPIVLVPHMHTLFPHNAWPAVGLIALAAAAHQGWSANLFATPADMFPSSSISTVVGLGGACGAAGGAAFTWLVSHQFTQHPIVIFAGAACAYLVALGIFQLLVPRLGMPKIGENGSSLAVDPTP